MKFKLLCVIIFLLLTQIIFSQSTYFIKYKNDVSINEIEGKVTANDFLTGAQLNKLSGIDYQLDFLSKHRTYDERIDRIIKIDFNNEISPSLINSLISDDPQIEYIQAANVYQVDYTPNDSMISSQWGLEKISAYNAWDITTGKDSIILGIIDTGVDYLHPDLQNKIYINVGETGLDNFNNDKRSNGIDDDNNGFIDDYMGWDFTDRVGFPFDSTGGDYLTWDNDPADDYGHGTFISGIAGAQTNNITGVAGVAPNITMLNLRAFDPNGYGEEDDVAAAIIYAVQMGANVINMSFGDNAFSLVLRDVISYAYSQNVVLVGSSGNSGSSQPHYPSGYTEVISVGNSTENDFVASNSNYGSTLDLVAPGTLILTTAKDNDYRVVSGTSASAPFVSASAALLLSLNNFSNEEIKQILKSTTDDIGEPGWDLKSGAGRLNLLKALSINSPSKIEFLYPHQDFATMQDTLNVYATVLSPYFEKYDLYYGIGLNPGTWLPLIQNVRNQFANSKITTLDLSQLADSSYTLRLLVYLTNGRTLEERVNFHINRTPPIADLISAGPAFYGDKKTILAAVYTDEPSIVKMYYKIAGSSGTFDFVTLDAFATNNQFVKNLHYGFIPKQLIQPNSDYEIYFEAENLVGLKTTLKNNNVNYLFSTKVNFNLLADIVLPYKLPIGTLFKDPTSFLSEEKDEILFNEFYPSQDLYYNLYRLEGDSLVKAAIDSIKNKIPREFGDFNNDGKADLLSSIQRTGFIDEQTFNNTFSFTNKFTDSTEAFWPALADDIDTDGINEILVVDSDTSIVVWKVDANLNTYDPARLINFTVSGFGNNLIDFPHAVIADFNNNGKKEIWMVDEDGDIYSYEALGSKNYMQDRVISTGFLGSASYLSSGDYNGDNREDLAVLLHSVDFLDIAPFYRLIIYDFVQDAIIYDEAFIDASTEFNSAFQKIGNTLRFVDIDNDNKDELALFTFPYAYILKDQNNNNELVGYYENINSTSVFTGDLNKNGITEIGLPSNSGIKFIEFANSNKAVTPYYLTGYSIDSNTVYLSWQGKGSKFYIFKGMDKNNLILLDSTDNRNYTDLNLSGKNIYYYSIKAFDQGKLDPLSNFSRIIDVYTHNPGKIVSVRNNSPQSLIISFSEKINNTIENLQSFQLLNVGYPNSVSPANQYAYLVNFKHLPIGSNTLIIKNLRDFYGSPIQEDTVIFNVDSIMAVEEFYIISHEIINPYLIKISFNLEVDPNSISSKSNYIFEPGNSISSVRIDQNNKSIIYLDLNGQKPVGSIGREYRLKLQNLKSSVESGGLLINSGAGSYIILTGFAKDLSSVYVYPNPAIINNGSGILTFANLPQRAKINIFNLSGEHIIELEENNGDGGVEYNLKNEAGEYINSGIYIFRIIRLDNQNNELEEKIGKFAIIK